MCYTVTEDKNKSSSHMYDKINMWCTIAAVYRRVDLHHLRLPRRINPPLHSRQVQPFTSLLLRLSWVFFFIAKFVGPSVRSYVISLHLE